MNIKMYRLCEFSQDVGSQMLTWSVIFCTTCLLFACNNTDSSKKNIAETTKVDSVAAFIIKKQPIQRSLTLSAELLPLEKAEIYGKMQGYIRQIRVDIGDYVRRGQVLALVDAPEMLANLSQAKARLGEVQATYSNSREYYQRLVKASQVKGTISANELSQAFTRAKADSAATVSARANINTYAALNNYLAILAPFSGIVTQRNADIGNLISTNDPRPILVVENNSQLRLRVPVPEMYASTSPQNKTVDFQAQTQADKTYQATFSRQSGSIDPTTRAETWEYLYTNNNRYLKSGMYVNVQMDLGRTQDGLAVPHRAIASNLEKKYVIVVRNGQALQVPVRIGFRMKEHTEIFGEINEGDTLLINPNDEIKDGQKLTVALQ